MNGWLAGRAEPRRQEASSDGRRFQRNPAGVLAVVAGVAIDVSGAVGGVVVVAVASGADLTVSVPACSLATATAPMTTTALAPITADSNLTFFCWSTLTTPSYPEKGLGIVRLLPLRRPETSCVKYLAWPSVSNAAVRSVPLLSSCFG